MLKKIITYFLILAVVLPAFAAAVSLPAGGQVLGAKTSFAEETITSDDKLEKVKNKLTEKSSSEGEVVEMCDFIWGKGTIVGCAMWLFVDWFLYKVVLKLSVLISSIAGAMFNVSIWFSLSGEVFDASENGNIMIKDGWAMVRDLLNLVFIFILLFAAISTILQYGNMDIKKILPSLIVAALLVNFSMMIAKMVIDASHIFAWEFYNQIDVKNKNKLGNKKEVANIKNDIEVYGDFEKKNLANVFMAGFNPHQLLTGNTTDPSAFAGAMKKAREDGNEVKIFSLMTQMMIILVLQSALALFGGFVLLAGAIMFVIRVVVLWLVMIFSPIAFLGYILPGMKEYSGMWWKYLIGQSFFAPAFLFMFMLVTKFINSDFIDSIVQATENSSLKIAFGLDAAVLIMPFFHYMVVGGLMMACLIVAKKLGAETAQYGMKWAHKGKDLALGGASKYMSKPLLRRTVGSISSGMAKSEWVEGMTARLPVIGGWMKGVLKKGGDVGGFDERMEQRIKTGQSLSTPKLRAQYLSNLSAREQAEWYKNASARTRVELEDAALQDGHVAALNNMIDVHKKLSLEEQEKTIKARAEVYIKNKTEDIAKAFLRADEALQREMLNQLKDEKKPEFVQELEQIANQPAQALQNMNINPQSFVTMLNSSVGNQIKSINPLLAGFGLPHGLARSQAISNAASTIKPSKARNLSHDARMARDVIKTLSKAHVEDLIKNGTLTDDEAKEIYDTVFDVLQVNPNDAWGKHILDYMEKGPSKDFWNSL